MPPFGGPDGQGPVLMLVLIIVLIEMPSFGGPEAKGRFWRPCYTILDRNATIWGPGWPGASSAASANKNMYENATILGAQMARGRFWWAGIRSRGDPVRYDPEVGFVR